MSLNYACFWTLLLLAALGPTGEATLYLDDHCDETVTNHGDRMYSQSSKNYDNNMDCSVKIQAPYDYQIVTVDFTWVDLDRWDCHDHINVYDTDGTILETICGNREPPDIYSSGNSIHIRLVTDNSGVDRGFSLVFTALHYDYHLPCNDTIQYLCTGNDRCIDDSLVCDDNNNCNNNADEDDCPVTRVWLILIVLFASMGIVAGIAYAIYNSCSQKKKQEDNSRNRVSPVPITTQEDVSYDADQHDIAMTTYPVAPPPYALAPPPYSLT